VSDIDRKLSLVAQGQSADFVLGLLKPHLDEQREAAIGRLKQLYRAQDTDGLKYIAIVSELCSLDDMEQRLISKIKAGNRNSKEIDRG
jgi:hypothetical protein